MIAKKLSQKKRAVDGEQKHFDEDQDLQYINENPDPVPISSVLDSKRDGCRS